MNLLNLLNNLDLTELLKEDNDTNIITNKLDFTKKEDLDKLIDAVDTVKNSDNPLVQGFSALIGNTLDDVVATAKKQYNEAHPVSAPIRKEKDNSVIKEPCRPSEKIAEEVQHNIGNLVADYVNTKILPNSNLTEEQYSSIADGLFEFACWMYNR